MINDDTAPADYLAEGLYDLRQAANTLEDVAAQLRAHSKHLTGNLDRHGDSFAQSPATKSTVQQAIDAATLDMYRAQRLLTEAMMHAASA